MFLWDNFLIVIMIGLLFFFFFTWVNFYIATNHSLTSLVLTAFFFYVWIKLPYRYVKEAYNNKDRWINMARQDSRANEKVIKHIEKMFNSRTTLFINFLKYGLFGYSHNIKMLINSYNEDPFTLDFHVHDNAGKRNLRDYEKNFLNSISPLKQF